ncbi:MAG: hypothetical protein LBK60_04865 [Verrucomicrobiales bacterium]|jgi:hypothetical protein|nr:hypothetical protein [Verrucomicrobiales bacterium]
MVKLVLIIAIVICANYGIAANEEYIEFYKQCEKQMIAATSGTWHYNKILPTVERSYGDAQPDAYLLVGEMVVTVWATKPLKLRGATNGILSDFLDAQKNYLKIIPKLTPAQALEQGKKYLSIFGILITSDITLDSIIFNGEPLCWRISWKRIAQMQYDWDDFDPTLYEGVSVVFHEEYGLVSLGNKLYTPSPQKLLVKIPQEQAIQKASQCAPLVFRTPFYRQARMDDGFVISGIKSCELKVSIPNWLLDPKRAWWPRTHAPTETRLCWVVRFSTVDGKADKRPMKLIPPDIVIYIDSETGECVGAGCT